MNLKLLDEIGYTLFLLSNLFSHGITVFSYMHQICD